MPALRRDTGKAGTGRRTAEGLRCAGRRSLLALPACFCCRSPTADSIIDNQIQPELLFRLIGANWDVYEIFLKARMGEVMLSETTRKLCENVAEGNRIERMRMYFWAGALFGVIKFWFTDGRDLSADEVAGMYMSLMTDVFAHRE